MASEGPSRRRLVVFVCAHGAVRSRVAAAFFNQVATAGWQATSAGVEPQEQLGETARQMLVGSEAMSLLDPSRPRGLDLLGDAEKIVAIDCEVPGAEQWHLNNPEFGQPMAEELRNRSADLATRLTREQT